MQEYTLYQNAGGNPPVTISIPEDWTAWYCGMPADDLPSLTLPQLRSRMDHPYGMPTIRQLAYGKKTAVIVFDDISRGTRLAEIAQYVVDDLLEAGLPEDGIEFLCAVGNHGAMTRAEFVQKLGESLVSRFHVFNHHPYENNERIGTTSNGIPVSINREFVESEVRIGIGAITPHMLNGFGGGGKLLFPGIASIETTAFNHNATKYGHIGEVPACDMRKEIEEMTRMAGPFFKIDVIYNSKLDIVDLFAGDPILEYYAGVEQAKYLYHSAKVEDMDVVVVNANAKINEADIAILNAAPLLKKSGGDIVLVNFCPYGQVTHYLSGPFGRNNFGRLWSPMGSELDHVRRIFCLSTYPDRYSTLRFGDVNGKRRVIWTDTWAQTLNTLRLTHGAGTRVAVLSDGTIQYFT